MSYDPGALNRTLAAAVGDDPALVAELHEAFVGGAMRHCVALARAADDTAWDDAAARLAGLAASFGASELLQLARRAAERPAGDVVILQALAQTIARLDR